MKKKVFKYLFLLFILCSFLLTGCNSVELDYNGTDLVFTVGSNDTKEITNNGAKVSVKKNQAFIRVNGEGIYDVYRQGNHKIKKDKKNTYKYYFVNLNEFKDVEYKTAIPISFEDEEYGTLEFDFYGKYDFQINNVDYFVKNYINGYLSIDATQFISNKLIEVLEKQLNKQSVSRFENLLLERSSLCSNASNELKNLGIYYSNIELTDIKLNDYSLDIIEKIETEKRKNELYIHNTVWIGNDNSELIFDKENTKWYKVKNVYNDNYFTGTFKFYMGESALEYLTQDLQSYGVTENDINTMINGNSQYSKENFIVFDFNYDAIRMDGKDGVPNVKRNPWYGFLLNEGKNLDVININTKASYKFTKQ